MTNALMTLVVTIFMTSILVIFLKVKNRNRLSSMSCMMIAMALGMMVGLLAGTILGISFKGNLFLATVYGASIGIIFGGVSGGLVSIIAFLDGILAGLMGGMMGAMLGEMLAPIYQEPTTKILFMLCLAVSFTLIYLIQKEVQSNNLFTIFFQNPIMMTVLFMFIIIMTNLQGQVWASSLIENKPHMQNQSHSNH